MCSVEALELDLMKQNSSSSAAEKCASGEGIAEICPASFLKVFCFSGTTSPRSSIEMSQKVHPQSRHLPSDTKLLLTRTFSEIIIFEILRISRVVS